MKFSKTKASLLAITLLFAAIPFGFTSCGEPGEGGEKKETVVIRAGIGENSVVDYTDMPFFQDLEEATGVRFELEEMSNTNIALMFSSGSYVDVLFGGNCTDSQLMIAANSGDVVELTPEMLSEYAPTWKKTFDENPDFYNASKFDGDKLYSLPYIRTLSIDRGVRDVWWINQKWLDELNLNMPKTLTDFKNVLRAFKANAGKGSIPEKVIPWYTAINSIIGGQFDFYASYGLPVYDYTYLGVDDSDKIVSYATDTRLKTAIKELSSMYAEGLITPEAISDDGNAYMTRTNSVAEVPYIGVFTAYWTPMEDYVPMTLFQSAEGVEPLIRQQPLGVIRNRAVIFSSCKAPERVLEALEWVVQEKNQMYLDFGKEGEGYSYDEASKTYTVHNADSDTYTTPGNAISGLLDGRFEGRITFDPDHSWYKRQQAIELYQGHMINLKNLIPPMMFSASAQEKADEYKRTFQAYIGQMTDKWVEGTSNVDSDWNAYVTQIGKLGMDEFVKLYQEAYDNFKS